MDKNAIKKFAVWARRRLIEDIQQKSFELGITEKEIKEPQVVSSDAMVIGDKTLNKVEMKQRTSLASKVKEKGYSNVIEEVAYTWFNRFIALRFMEVNGYLPTGVRVLSSMEPGKKEPDIIHEALNIDLNVDNQLIYQLLDANDTVGLYRYLLVKQCNALYEILPGLFEPIEDYTEILLPSNLLSEGSVIRELVDSISEDEFKEQVEIIGWMYQYYISEKKDEVFEGLKKNIKITKENIPAATQLFTPDWIVKYMIENSLGRLWLEGHSDDELKAKWKYYIEEAEQEQEVEKQLEEIRANSGDLKPEDIKVLDPAMGSGHILVYAFDVLYDIYKSAGYAERDIPKLILNHNLYGLDIDDRATQLAHFAVMMKARSKSRRILNQVRDEKIELNLYVIQESNGISKNAFEYLVRGVDKQLKTDIEYLNRVFHDAKEYGSILEVKPVDIVSIENRLAEIKMNAEKDVEVLANYNDLKEKFVRLLNQTKIMSCKYHVVCTNPPYMGFKGMGGKLSEFLKKVYPNSKSDLFATFMEVPYKKQNGYLAMINQNSWMFLSSFEELRGKTISTQTIINMLHLGPRTFEEIGGEVVQSTAFVLKGKYIEDYKSVFIRLIDIREARQKEIAVLNLRNNPELYFTRNVNEFQFIPGTPIAYWTSNAIYKSFEQGTKFGEIATLRQGLSTGDNERFLRLWYEVEYSEIGFGFCNKESLWDANKKYVPLNKGGSFRKWYGNNEYVIKFDKENYEILLNSSNHLPSRQFYFREGITWSNIATTSTGFRRFYRGYVFSNKGACIFLSNEEQISYFIALLNTKIVGIILKILSPAIGFEPGYIASIPIINNDKKHIVEDICSLAIENINISRNEWDNYETSWDFQSHPFFKHIKMYDSETRLRNIFDSWKAFSDNQFAQLKVNEEILNRIFTEIYGLQDELTPEVDDKDITIRKADRVKDIKSFISYATGCMLGRYSIDAQGLIHSGGEWRDNWRDRTVRKIEKDEEGNIISHTWVDATFLPEKDNIIPIADDEYFDNDILSRFIEFLKVTFSEDTLEENLDFIADALGKKPSETSRQTIRRYFLKDFYKDHIQTYQKKPIYWLFDSGRQDGFKSLIYMHRYDEHTVARIRTDYLHKLQKSYEAELKRLDVVIDSSSSEREKANARKRKEKILKQMEECLQYDQVIAHVANQRIKIDLDDGVSVNYAKFQGVEIPQGEGKKPLRADLLAKI